jgi:hypothetical protein
MLKSLVASSYQAPGLLSREGNRTCSPDLWRIKSTHALSHKGEDLDALPYKCRTVGKWDT